MLISMKNPFIKNVIVPVVAVYLFVNFGIPTLEANPYLILLGAFGMFSYVCYMAHTSESTEE